LLLYILVFTDFNSTIKSSLALGSTCVIIRLYNGHNDTNKALSSADFSAESRKQRRILQ
jgi:hypothetical protein